MHFSIDRTVHTTAFDKPVVDHWLERKSLQKTVYIFALVRIALHNALFLQAGAMGRRIDPSWGGPIELFFVPVGARCNSVVIAFAHGAMGRRIDTSWGGPIGLFLVTASAPRLV